MSTATDIDIRTIEAFLYREARLADAHDYDGWEALWTDDAIYWVPVDGEGRDPLTTMSIIYDNRNRIGTRLNQLRTGKRYSQAPRSDLCDPHPARVARGQGRGLRRPYDVPAPRGGR
jgi:benzoate/toluate 1,2-dioxygenase beta subunit